MRVFLGLFLIPILLSIAEGSVDDDSKHGQPNSSSDPTTIGTGTRSMVRRMISLAESINITQRSLTDPEITRIRRKYWKDTFDDIHKLAWGSKPSLQRQKFSSQWKRLSNSNQEVAPRDERADTIGEGLLAVKSQNQTSNTLIGPRRFEGFTSWERLMQDWSEEIQDYLDRVDAESSEGYSFSNFGRAPVPKNDGEESTKAPTASDATQGKLSTPLSVPALSKENGGEVVTPSNTVDSSKGKKWTPLPMPEPAKDGEEVLPHTDLGDKSKRILIVTTASLPWRTGTAVNPLLRAAYMCSGRKEFGGGVTLMLPWLERREDQVRVYGDLAFDSPEDQEQFIRTWLLESADMKEASEDLKIRWYTAWQNKVENSIYSMGDITSLVSADDIDICILEEPEHLNWYRAPGESWTKKFKHVVGILHTNYFQYALDQPAAVIRAPAMRLLCSWMCRAHCHRVIKLSGTIDQVAPEKELIENVHGVRKSFLTTGATLREKMLNGSDENILNVFNADSDPKIYFIGKLLWSKGLGSLMELLKYAEESANLKVKLDVYGSGPDKDAAEAKAIKLGLDLPFHGPLDHAELSFTHKIFINPSTSEVLCTTTAEALAMGKFVIIPSHPSNDFFAQFSNCLTYATRDEFVGNLYYAISHAPELLSADDLHELTWEAATDRLIAAGCIPKAEADRLEAAISSEVTGIEITLPPLVESEEGRKSLSTVLRLTRHRYRRFRTRLSQEISNNKVLPESIRNRLVAELEKRFDFDIDELLESPKLRLKLSPGEVDKALLELYDTISESPGGDILRLIGGGGSIGLQNLYMRRHVEKERWRKLTEGSRNLDLFPTYLFSDERRDAKRTTASDLVRTSLRRNIPDMGSKDNTLSYDDRNEGPKMCFASRQTSLQAISIPKWNGLKRIPSRTTRLSLLI